MFFLAKPGLVRSRPVAHNCACDRNKSQTQPGCCARNKARHKTRDQTCSQARRSTAARIEGSGDPQT